MTELQVHCQPWCQWQIIILIHSLQFFSLLHRVRPIIRIHISFPVTTTKESGHEQRLLMQNTALNHSCAIIIIIIIKSERHDNVIV